MKKIFIVAICQLLFITAIGCGVKNAASSTTRKKEIKQESTSYSNNFPLSESKTDKYYIEELLSKYEKNICDAINMNDFSLVGNSLINGSNLYSDQKKLVRDLWNQKIYEAPVSHDIVKIEIIDKAKGEYYVFTKERVAIKYPQNDKPVIKDFNWIYTAVVDRAKSIVGLSDIKKWEN